MAKSDSPSSNHTEAEYVLGTHDEELHRLGLQHRVWRPRASDAWRRAGFTVGQTLLDVGAGPGYATTDLAEIVGQEGEVIALERSPRFIAAMKDRASQRGLTNITSHEIDLDTELLPEFSVDGVWVRWLFAFLRNPKDLLHRIVQALKPGGVLVIHEYFDYGTWRSMDRAELHDEFVRTVMRTWRANGGEPDIALDLLGWIEDAGMHIESTRTIVDVISPTDYAWQWPKSFIDINLRRLVSSGDLQEDRANAIREEFATLETKPHARMVTPGVLEIIARK